jgi:hypothetical protein
METTLRSHRARPTAARAAATLAALLALLPAALVGAAEPADDTAKPAAAPTAAAPAGPRANLKPSDLENPQRYATTEDLESLKDVLEEKILRGVGSRYRINFSGFITAGYTYQRDVPYTASVGTPPVATVFRDSSSTFRLVNANASFAGFLRENPIDDGDLRYKVSFFYSGPSSSSANGQTGNTSSVQVTDGVILWDLVRQKKDLEPTVTVNLTLGQQLVPFGADNTATEDKIPTINLAQYLGAYGLRRDLGLVVDGGFFHRFDPPSGLTVPLLAYTVGVFNGAGANKWDDNKAKDVVAKLVYTPEARFFSIFRGLKLGGSLYKGNLWQSGLPLKDRWSAELEWLRKPFLLTAEFVRGKDRATANATAVKTESLVATLFYQADAIPDFQPLVRFDSYDPNAATGDNARIVGTVGFNWFFWQVEPVTRRTYEVAKTERVVKLQANWNRVWDHARGNGSQLLAQLVASF